MGTWLCNGFWAVDNRIRPCIARFPASISLVWDASLKTHHVGCSGFMFGLRGFGIDVVVFVFSVARK